MAEVESDFDAIVVGAGPAGSVAALELARAGKSVLLVERGNYVGAKNMTGGRIYSHCLRGIFPKTFDQIPFERKVAHERIALMASDACLTVDFLSEELMKEGQESYTVLRAPFDEWLANQAEEAGAEVVCGITVERLLKDIDGSITGTIGKVYGIQAGEDELTSKVVVLCDGANSLLAHDAVGCAVPKPDHMAVGIKQVLELDARDIEQRFQCEPGEGAAWLFAGDATRGAFGGGIIYTNRDSLSVGIVVGIEAVIKAGAISVYQMLEDFKRHPAVAPVLKGSKVVEHSAHMIPEGGFDEMPPICGDGVVLAGDVAMMCVNVGYTVRGLDYAIAAGMTAGRECAKAIDADDTSMAGLKRYANALDDSFVMSDLRQFRDAPAFMTGFDRIFNGYPEMARDMMNSMFVVNGMPVQPIRRTVTAAAKKIGYMNILRDVRGALRSL